MSINKEAFMMGYTSMDKTAGPTMLWPWQSSQNAMRKVNQQTKLDPKNAGSATAGRTVAPPKSNTPTYQGQSEPKNVKDIGGAINERQKSIAAGG